MPIYEYRRPDGSTFEVMQSFSDAPLTTDPETGVALERVLHAPALHFKGSGFYNTDYGSRKRQRENAAAEGVKAKADGQGSKTERSASNGDAGSGSGSSTDSSAGAPKAAVKD